LFSPVPRLFLGFAFTFCLYRAVLARGFAFCRLGMATDREPHPSVRRPTPLPGPWTSGLCPAWILVWIWVWIREPHPSIRLRPGGFADGVRGCVDNIYE